MIATGGKNGHADKYRPNIKWVIRNKKKDKTESAKHPVYAVVSTHNLNL